jgi:hypothetical protein
MAPVALGRARHLARKGAPLDSPAAALKRRSGDGDRHAMVGIKARKCVAEMASTASSSTIRSTS